MPIIQEEDLVHYGTKGMRWGVRKKPTYIDRKAFRGRNLQKENIRVLEKGSTVHHVTVDPKLAPRVGGLYVSYTEADAKTYRTEYKTFLEVMRDADKVFEYDMKATEDIITPSKQKKIDTFLEMHRSKSSEQLITAMGKNKMQSSWGLGIAKYFGYDRTDKVTKKYREMINSDNPRVQQKAFNDFAQFLVWEPKIRKNYFAKLAKEGFNAMYDDFDMGQAYSKEPLIVFDPSKTLTIEKKTEV
jgi:hypothetical protein